MARPALNLARRPFLNRRPVWRAALLLMVLAGAVWLVDLVLYGHSLIASRTLGQRRDEVQGWLQEERGRFNTLLGTTEFQGLTEYNRTVHQLNELIAERTFPWGRLFDQLSELMPPGVRLQRLSPARERRGQQRSSRRRGETEGPRAVQLSIDGVAQSDEALYEFVDALFAAPTFETPVLDQESQKEGGRTFTVQVQYLITSPPSGDQEPVTGDQEEAGAPRNTDERQTAHRSLATGHREGGGTRT